MSVYKYTIELEDFNSQEMKDLEEFLKENTIPFRKVRKEEIILD